jgi:(p)ppGpp synthase/HD superfamily hydrolase
MSHSDEYEQAMRIAVKAHEGQKDWYGGDYVNHPMTVSSYCKTERGRIAALLHDVIEDTSVTADDLRLAGIGEDVVHAVICLTKLSGESIDDYHKRVIKSDMATEVKFADMRHNSDKSRFPPEDHIKAENTHKKYFGRASELMILIGNERAKELMTSETYEWFTGQFSNE